MNYKKFVFPYLKKSVEKLAEAGCIIDLHFDCNWTPMLEYLRELPKRKCVLELDNTTDIFKAKKILGDRICIKGDVHSTLQSFGIKKD